VSVVDRKWEDAIVRAAAEASRLQPLATILFVAAVLSSLGDALMEPLAFLNDISRREEGTSGIERRAELAELTGLLGERLLRLTPVIPLIFALWETRAYLGRLARGEVGGPATMQMLGRVGGALLWSAGLSMFVVPTLTNWVHGGFDFDFSFDAASIALAGLGLLLSLVARVVRNVVDVAAALKQENDEIV
jgi:hypothetical protein